MSALPVNPRFLGIGGCLKALLVGLTGSFKELPRFSLCPLLLVIWLPLWLILPPLATLGLRSLKEHKPIRVLGSGALLRLLSLELIYLLTLYVIYMVVSALQAQAFTTYLTAVAAHPVVQIGTSEQLAYARKVQFLWQGAFFIYALLLFVQVCLTNLSLSSLSLGQCLKLTFSSLLKNLPGLLLLLIIAILVFTGIEHYFATLKIAAIRGQLEATLSTLFPYAFILLRLYLAYAWVTALALCSSAALGYFNLQVRASDKDRFNPAA